MPSTTINRIAYFAQSGSLTTLTGIQFPNGNTWVLPINSANIEVTRPVEPITSLGQFNSLNTAQTNLTTCKATLKGYLGSGTNISGLTASGINDLIYATQYGTGAGGIVITVGPDGFTMTGVLSSIGLDISMGGLGMFDLGFAGVGRPTVFNPQGGSPPANNQTGLSLAPITTMSVGTLGLLSGSAATSVKFSYDLPTDVIAALGDNPNAFQGNLVSFIATKAPYKTSFSLEGYGVNTSIQDVAVASGVSIGTINIVLPHAKVNSFSFSQAAGQVSASFSLSAEDVGAILTDIVLSGYQETGSNISTFGPAYGA